VKITLTNLPGVVIVEPRVFPDARGFFLETWNRVRYGDAGLPADFAQDNLSLSSHGVLRGLHFQNPNPQGKLVYVLQGEIFDVAVDIRAGSPTFGQWVGVVLTAEGKRQLYIPEGFAHGFCVLSETALFAYKCTGVYNPRAEHTVLWSDPDVAIDWPVSEPILSDKDARAPRLSELAHALPAYGGK